MIKKLRRKFVIINMSLVAVILCVVLGMFCFTRIHSFRVESEMAMRQMLDSSRSKEPPSDGRHLIRFLFFWSHWTKTMRSQTPVPAAPIP